MDRTRVFGATLLLALVLLAAPTLSRATEPFRLPPQDENGRFQNIAPDLQRAGATVTLPFFLRQMTKSSPDPDDLPARVHNDGGFLRRNAGKGVATITWIGHATFLVQMGGKTFLTDPMWSERASPVSWVGPKRFQPPGIELDDLPPIDFVVVSHNNYDHLDLPSLAEIAIRNTTARFFVPLENGELLREAGIPNVEEMTWGETVRIGDLEVHCLPSQHWSRRGLFDGNSTLWASWAVLGPDERFYFAGDTGYFSGFAKIGDRLGPFDLAAVPIGAYRPVEMMRIFHMSPAEAVKAGTELKARQLIGMHYGTFDLSDETASEAVGLFRGAGPAGGYQPDQILLPPIGETRLLESGAPAGGSTTPSSRTLRK